MQDYKRILVAIDERPASQRILDFVAALGSGRDDLDVHLFHAMGPLPPQLLESRGAEDPAEERRIESQQARQQNEWVNDEVRGAAEQLFADAEARLGAEGSRAARTSNHLIVLNFPKDLISEILKAARDNNCGTVIVGKSDYPWFRELFQSHVGEQLVAEAQDLAVCVVG